MQWLAKLAILSDRIPVWPSVDCKVPYASGVKQEPNKEGVSVPFGWLAYFSHR